jgi:hypothetical protein
MSHIEENLRMIDGDEEEIEVTSKLITESEINKHKKKVEI